MDKIILVEDDDRLRKLVSDFLIVSQFTVLEYPDGSNLVNAVREHRPALVILDVMLPGEDGFTLCKALRKEYSGPLLFMTAKDDDFDQVLGLEIGADDYVTKPIEPRVLLARVHALLRRVNAKPATTASNTPQKLVYGGLVIDKTARSVKLGGQLITLTSHEFDMLWLLACRPSQVVDRNTIYEEIIGREYDGLDRSADVRISRLRKKLFDNPSNPFRIKTIWGKGFFFVADAWEA
ncbi:response regulator [Alteromonas pelagimontana]|uniref:Response regulator n=1 Tax=Alteromonas pelagimontana TaxID=1858656 RepID=A0A6M4MAN7_9ALTE|nr:response regulator [Alteromonas pelagimontana]QJR80234.1 response regulator [Alteromonas pelagimontana]